MIPNRKLLKEYVFLWIKHKINEIILNETGGAQPHIDKSDINETDTIIPDDHSMEKYIEIANPIFENQSQIRTLEKLRDTLLPKLMSGKVRVET